MNYKDIDKKIESEENEDIILFMINQRHELEPYPNYLFTEDLYTGLYQSISTYYNGGINVQNPTRKLKIQTGSAGMSNLSTTLKNTFSTGLNTTIKSLQTGKGTNINTSYSDRSNEIIYIFRVKNFRFQFINNKFEKFDKY